MESSSKEILDGIFHSLKDLSQESKELYLGFQVPEVVKTPDSALAFYRSYVSANRPVVIRGAVEHWPAIRKWTHDHLRFILGNAKVTVAVTPNGYADAIHDGLFVMPHEEEMTMGEFLDIIDEPNSHSVHYIQRQNSNLTDEFSLLMEDISELSWAREAFDKAPDAINFWMGDARAITSTHKDPYENIYAVVRGYKDFTIFPPTDEPWLKYEYFEQAKFQKDDNGTFEVVKLDAERIPWITMDPDDPDMVSNPDFKHANPFKVRLHEGDVLYLPSLWFHHLKQSHGCIAVNFWYDMEFDVKYNYFNFLSSISKLRNEYQST